MAIHNAEPAEERFGRLIGRGLITDSLLRETLRRADASGTRAEVMLLDMGIPRHEILLSLSEYYGLPFIEYDEDVVISQGLTRGMDVERLKAALWMPVSVRDGIAEVIACDPRSPAVIDDIRSTLGVYDIEFVVALHSDLVRIIENHQDLNPGFPPSAGRTPLAKARTFLANRRSLLACYRTYFAKGRTGLAFLRTGLSFMTIAVLLMRLFGTGRLPALFGAGLLVAGVVMVVDGLMWYLPARKIGGRKLECGGTTPTWGTTVLETRNPGPEPEFARTRPVAGAEELRKGWEDLSPVMRRRFLASDRTDMAEERTTLACYRTVMAKARTGLAFARTGVAFAGLGIAFLRQFREGPWTAFDISLITVGVLMVMEGLYWYLPGRGAGERGRRSVEGAMGEETIWDMVFPPRHMRPAPPDFLPAGLPVKVGHSPGIWATTGLALERTVLADRRNLMARLRTVMARSRTGLAFIRTGMAISAVGLGLLAYFGTGSAGWTAFDAALTLAGLAFIADGLYWHIPADRVKRQFPYCYGDFEVTVPDYGRPGRYWKKAVFSHDDV